MNKTKKPLPMQDSDLSYIIEAEGSEFVLRVWDRESLCWNTFACKDFEDGQIKLGMATKTPTSANEEDDLDIFIKEASEFPIEILDEPMMEPD